MVICLPSGRLHVFEIIFFIGRIYGMPTIHGIPYLIKSKQGT
jgi:hypothetical protein